MCATCGCSDESHARLTDMQTGETIILHEHHNASHDVVDSHHHHHHHHGGDHHSHVHEPGRIVRLEQELLARNDRQAARNREWLNERGALALDLLSSPGSGKTTLLERTLRDLGGEIPILVIEGDQETLHDARRIQAAGGRAVQINTGTACHLDATMIAGALPHLDPPRRSIVMIENVGNLVCPAFFDLGEHARVVIVSVTEGDDKPLKYPHMFRAATLLLLNKIDLLPHVAFDFDRFLDSVHQVNPVLKTIRLSATTGEGLADWHAWIRAAHERAHP